MDRGRQTLEVTYCRTLQAMQQQETQHRVDVG